METSRYITRHLDRILLDPNNYRFIDHLDYKAVPENHISDKQIQLRTFNLLVGKNHENIKDLINSFKANGILKLDPLQLKEVEEGLFVVIEGNRRAAALKYLQEELRKGNDVGLLTQESFRSVEAVLIVDESPVQHLVTMGLHHISGKKKWSPVNQAQLIHDLHYKYEQSEEKIIQSLSITKHALRRSLRTLSLINEYKKSDFGDQFTHDKYSIFEEITKSPKIKEWLNWDEQNHNADNVVNREYLFSWISSTEETTEEDDESESYDSFSDTTLLHPIITKSHEIRDLAKFIDDKSALETMEESRSVTHGFALSDAVADQKLTNAVSNILKDIDSAFKLSHYLNKDHISYLEEAKSKINRIIPEYNLDIHDFSSRNSTNDETLVDFLSSITIEQHNGIINLELKETRKINLIVGGNNSGKSTVLESIYMLSQLNRPECLVEVAMHRHKSRSQIKPELISEHFNSNIKIQGVFNLQDTSVSISNQVSSDDVDKSGYITTLTQESMYGDEELFSATYLYRNKKAEFRYDEVTTLCPAQLTSPYTVTSEIIATAYDKAIDCGYLDKIIQFIQTNIDPGIIDIKCTSDSRFIVTSASLDKPLNINKYGDGLQRIFQIAVLLTSCQNGLMCIDEIDAAIHYELLIPFTEFIQKLADHFNVQLFISTHSKECIDAFIKNGYNNNSIMAHAIYRDKENKVSTKRLAGEKLERKLETFNIDIR